MILNWGASTQERNAVLPCDALPSVASLRADRAISIGAPRSTVFAWLCQLRVAPYSYDLIDNFGRRSPRTRDPELTQLHTGQRFMQIFTLHSFADEEHLTLQSGRVAVTYGVRDEAGGTRLHVRVRFGGTRLVGWALAAGDVVMMRKQLINLRDLAEQEAAQTTS
ncbi:hypothetical protein A5731_14880 [Mycolicibacterium conceptionense]|uniref:Polyketide cyclase / dehydrase and lipid transport n=3 Tax=Mycolicibacterium TaxID=1866885 RepID=A0A0J8X1K8_9MYCO|nr:MULTISPECIES: hypothetical protein [Mycolicibacterium]KLI08500.1 hypothetical protein AA982_08700 [Mycolicibacterium senegalense]KLO52174.1 hypothetical protein ABW05_12245 [Mycolicibacterium senegalense]KMV19319.1 hypothetical protein ACT17_07810 [Mycolicibacterium conceptionense]MCW1820222.1 hypothetical protein [Mycolicibacterium senegalense]OBB07264.1 hypothetical protein A5718_17380 [Mycolicibacterium conceptionense]